MSSREQMASRRQSSALAGRSGGGWQAAPPGRLLPQHSQPLRPACEKPAPKQNKKSDSGRCCPREGGNRLRAGGGAGRREGGRENRQTPQYFRRQAGWLGRDHWLRPPRPGALELPGLPFASSGSGPHLPRGNERGRRQPGKRRLLGRSRLQGGTFHPAPPTLAA